MGIATKRLRAAVKKTPKLPADGLYAQFLFDESDGSIAHSTFGDAALTVGASNWTADARHGAALTSNGGVRAVHGSILPDITQLTVTCWAKLTAMPDWQSFIEIVTGTTTELYFELSATGQIDAYLASPGTLTVNGSALVTGRWYHLALVLSTITKTITLYVDGVQVGIGTDTTMPAQFNWSTAMVNVCGPATGTSGMLLDELSVYTKALSADQIATAYGGAVNNMPNASFTLAPNGLTVTLDASGATDSDGTIDSYAWNFGDSTTGSGKTATHTYSAAGAYTVTLTVTDNAGAKNVASKTVAVISPAGLAAGGSIFYPSYICQNTVYTRSVASMPLAANSALVSQYMTACIPAGEDATTSIHYFNYNLPVYIVDSSNPATPKVTVNYSGPYQLSQVSPTWVSTLYNTNIPIPGWARAAEGTDASMAIYDSATGLLREYFNAVKQADGSWTAWAGGYADKMPQIAAYNYACQLIEGSDFAFQCIGSATQVGIEELRRGSIDHAIGMVVYNARQDVWSWPAKYSDGTSTDANAPVQGQWFRFRQDIIIDNLPLRPLTKLLCKAIQTYGGTPVDKSLFHHYVNCEPGYNELHEKGIDPWQPGGDLYAKFGGNYDINDLPWQYIEWATLDWGKP